MSDKGSVPRPKLSIEDSINRKLYARLSTIFRELSLCYISEETILKSGFRGQDASDMKLDAVSHADFILCYG